MKVIFLSNYYSHHQKSFCENMDQISDHQFLFLETEDLSDERKQMGWKEYKNIPFVKKLKEASNADTKADVVIWGNAPSEAVRNYLESDILTFRYSERIYKSRYNVLKWLPRMFRFWQKYGRYSSLYLLCSGAYTYLDYAIHGSFIGKAYKWGYFPETILYQDVDMLLYKKNRTEILWCGRFIEWKHPDDAIVIANMLKQNGYDFTLKFIGTGEMEDQLKDMAAKNNLEDCVCFMGAMSPEQVRENMEKAGIYLFTSDRKEGWGAVLNESMNSGCAVIASHRIGSVPYLVKNGENGIIYRSGDINSLYSKVKFLLDNPERQKSLGKRAYYAITDLWNAQTAAERLMVMTEEIQDHGFCDLYEDGPCSRADLITDGWFQE